jgi:hypothetical protein
MMRTTFLLLILFIFIHVQAQIAWLDPPDPSPTDTVTLIYNTSEGNKALADYEGAVYLHAGVITQESIDGGDWKHVIGNWGKDDPRVKMIPIGNGLHQFTLLFRIFMV